MTHRHHPPDHDPESKTLKEILEVELDQLKIESESLSILREIRKELRPHPLTALIAISFQGPFMNSLIYNAGQSSTGTITPLLADGVTPSGGTLSNVVWTFSDPTSTIVDNGDGTATFTAVAAGSASGQAAATVTDTDGAVSQFSQGFTVTVNAVIPPSQLTQSIGVNFSTPTP